MIRLFKDIRIKYYLTEIIGIILLIILSIYLYKVNHNKMIIVLMIFLMVIYIIIIAMYFLNKSIKKFTKTVDKINNISHIKEGILEYEEMYKRVKDKKIKTLLVSNLAGAYTNIGKTKKAMSLFKDFEPVFDDNQIGLQNRIIYLNNVCEICIREELFSLAQSNLTVMKQLINSNKLGEDIKKVMSKAYQDLIIELVFRQNEIKDYKSIEKYYLKRFKEENDTTSRVFFSYQLSKVYKNLKDKKKVKEYQDYYNENRKTLNFN